MAAVTTLRSAWDVDRHIVLESAEKLVLVRFSSFTSAADEAEEYQKQPAAQRHRADAMNIPTTSTAPSASTSSSFSAMSGAPGHKRARDDTVSEDGAALHTSATTAALLSRDVNEHYLRTRQMDSLLLELAPKVRKYCKIFFVDTREVTAFNELYELGHDRDPFAVMFFYRNRHICIDVGTGNNNKINFFAFEDLYDFLPLVDAAYKAGRQGRSITSSDRKFSTVALRR